MNENRENDTLAAQQFQDYMEQTGFDPETDEDIEPIPESFFSDPGDDPQPSEEDPYFEEAFAPEPQDDYPPQAREYPPQVQAQPPQAREYPPQAQDDPSRMQNYPPRQQTASYPQQYAVDPEPAAYDSQYALPPSRFTALFGESRFLSVLSLLSGVAGVSWLLLYVGMLIQRDSLFTQAVEAMSVQGRYEYSVTFSSPVLGVLRVMLYLVPVVALIWSVTVAAVSKRGKSLGKKAVLIAVLAVFVVVGLVAVFDVFAAGLVFDVMKN